MLSSMFAMMGTYEQRKVSRHENKKDGVVIDTCAVTDSDKPYETAIRHPSYNNKEWIIVELYNTKKESLVGHKKWIKKITAKKLPKQLKDVSTSKLAELYYALRKNGRRKHDRQ